jgi:hypothetical protein
MLSLNLTVYDGLLVIRWKCGHSLHRIDGPASIWEYNNDYKRCWFAFKGNVKFRNRAAIQRQC